jgi:hypothetical protein
MMLGIGLVMMAGMFFGMFAMGGGPHHMADIHRDHGHNTVQTDHGRGRIGGGEQQVTHGDHDHVRTDASAGNEDKEN